MKKNRFSRRFYCGKSYADTAYAISTLLLSLFIHVVEKGEGEIKWRHEGTPSKDPAWHPAACAILLTARAGSLK